MKPHPSAKQGWGLHFVALPGSQLAGNSPNFVILGRSDAKRSEDPRIHAVTSAEGRNGAKFCTVASHWRNGMDSMVYAASLRSLLRHRMTS